MSTRPSNHHAGHSHKSRYPKKLRNHVLNDIPDLVSTILSNHIEECDNYASETKLEHVNRMRVFNRREYRTRRKCVDNREWYISQHVRQRMRDNDQRDLTHVDPSFLALQTVPSIPLSIERSSKSRLSQQHQHQHKTPRSRYGGLLLSRCKEVPRYDAWIPVLVNYWVGKDLHLEPYMPFLGDQDNECEAAFEVYEDMAGDAGKDAELSDGELNESGKFVLPHNELERVRYYSMAQTRLREAMRKAVLAVINDASSGAFSDDYGDDDFNSNDVNSNDRINRSKRRQRHANSNKDVDEQVWHVLAQALGLRNDVKRVKAIARVARERLQEQEETRDRRQFDKYVKKEFENLRKCPREEVLCDDERSPSANVLKHFCFTCYTIPCAQHAGMDVEPVLPIEDPAAIAREQAIHKETAPACSPECGLRHIKRACSKIASKNNNKNANNSNFDITSRHSNGMGEHQLDHHEPEDTKVKTDETIDLTSEVEWTPEEIMLLRDAVTIFGMDPCSLAVVIGSRTCSEVAERLNDPIEADILQCELKRTKAPRRTLGEKRRSAAANGAKMDVVLGYEAQKTIVDVSDDGGGAVDQDFEPCEHAGPCTAENNCPCVKKGLFCETTCGCNSGRYSQQGATGGIVWVPPSEESVRDKRAAICANRHYGCSCTAGTCTGPECPCWENYRACSPDFCECDVTCLPGHMSIQQRQCRNWPITVGRHKRTFIGHSEVHGFGLFAGERFEEGDLVGVYSGQLIDTRLADMIGRIYDATNRTYIFNMTESLVIDGGLLGSKAKFVNHTKPGSKENCGSRLVRVRGDAFVALFAKRTVVPGEEFLFDYRFTGEVPAWAKDDKSKSKK